VGFWMGKFWTKIFEDSSLLWIGMLELVTRTNIFFTRQKWGLIQYLVPYVYFRFHLGPLCFKCFNLVFYVYFRVHFGHFRHMWQTVCIRRVTRGHLDTWKCVQLKQCWIGLGPENHWASRNDIIGTADPVFAQSINIGLAYNPQRDKVRPSLHASIGTRASRLRRSLNRPANKEHIFPLPKG
jgi:hypothetical protein